MSDQNTWILAVDTATGPCSVALLEGGHLRVSLREDGQIQQARRLVPMIEEALARACIGYEALGSIVTTTGPGSFTGLRVGLATANASGLAADIPVYGVSTLAALAFKVKCYYRRERYILSLINAGKNETYFQLFDAKEGFSPLSSPLLGGIDAVVETLEGRSCVAAGFTDMLPENPLIRPLPDLRHPEASAAGLLAVRHPDLLGAAEPLYIRPPDAQPSQDVASAAGSFYDEASR